MVSPPFASYGFTHIMVIRTQRSIYREGISGHSSMWEQYKILNLSKSPSGHFLQGWMNRLCSAFDGEAETLFNIHDFKVVPIADITGSNRIDIDHVFTTFINPIAKKNIQIFSKSYKHFEATTFVSAW
jgi:hypothetical protein